MISQDKYNWIVKLGSSKLTDKQYAKQADCHYFTNLELMFKWLLKHCFKKHLQSLDINSVLEAIGIAENRVNKIGQALDQKYGRLEGRK